MPFFMSAIVQSAVDALFSLLHPASHGGAAQSIAGVIGAVATLGVFSAPPPVASELPSLEDVPADETRKQEEQKRRKLETAVMPEGVRTVVAGSGTPVWLYARMLSAATPEAPFEPDAELTDGILFRVESGGSAVVLGSREAVGDWVAVGVGVDRPADGSPPPDSIRIAVERFTTSGTLYHRRTITLRVAQG